MDLAADMNIGLSAFVGLGNRVGIDENDLIEYFDRDQDTRVISLYLESFADGKKFMEVCKRCSKPVVVLKAGRSETAKQAVQLHTGSLAGSYKVVEGVFKQIGVVSAMDEEEFLDYSVALSYQKPVEGKRIGILTSAGGPGVITSDLLEKAGFEIPELPDETKEELRGFLLPIASVRNPVDLTASADNEQHAKALKVLDNCDSIDAIICFVLLNPPGVSEELLDLVAENSGNKPIIVCSIGGDRSRWVIKKFQDYKIPAYPSISRAVKALKVLRV